MHHNPEPGEIRRLLHQVRRIAVVGLSPRPHRDSHRVSRYLLERGYDDDALAAGGRALWFQLGCIHAEAAQRATHAGCSVVVDRCIMVDYATLLGRDSRAT